MTREEYELLSVSFLKDMAKKRGIKGVSAMRKSGVIDALLAAGQKDETSGETPGTPKPAEQDHPMQRESVVSDVYSEEVNPGVTNQKDTEQREPLQTDAEYRSERKRDPEQKEYTLREHAQRERDHRGQTQRTSSQQERRTDNMRQKNQMQREYHPGSMQQRRPMNNNASQNTQTPRQDRPPMELKQLDSGNTVTGVLEVMADGYGFLRSKNFLPGEEDVYVSPSQIRKFNLKTGDVICGNTRIPSQQEKFSALLFVKSINDFPTNEAVKRFNFEDMTPIFPNERLRMERAGREIAMRIIDILAPIGKGQRGLIVSPPKAGKTTLLKDIARSIQKNNPEMHIIIMLIDERPEEVTDIREAIVGENVEVLDSTFDETPEHHRRVAEMGLGRAMRLVEHCKDVVILLDSITRLARAYNLIVPPSGRTLSGGLDPAALHPPKRFFGAARNMREGGSLTILATALVDTGSKMDDVVYEEFKGTGNMELILDRKLSERRVFPAIDIMKSGTRREDLLLTTDEGEAAYVMRRQMNGAKGEDAVERILEMFARTRSNEELIQRIKHSHVI